MTAVLSPILVGVPSVKTGGAINSGGFIYTYVAGTTTPFATYTTNALSVQNANPIVLNSYGLAPQEIWWASGSLVKFLVTDSAGNTIGTYDNLTGVNDVGSSVGSEWIDLGLTPTYISATSFSVTGNQTSTLMVGRRLKTTNTVGAVYSTLSAVDYNVTTPSVTTVTVVNDSSTLDSGLSAVAYGLLSATNPSEPTITGLSALTAVDISADYVAVLDTSAGKTTKALAGYVGQGQRIASNIAASSGATVSLFTGITAVPYRQIVIVLKAVSLSGTDDILINLGDTGGYGSTTYDSTGSFVGNAGSTTARRSTAGILIPMGNAALTFTGVITLTLIQEAAIPGGDLWIASGNGIYPGSTFVASVSGFAQLTSATPRTTLDRIQLAATGANNFDGSGVAFAYARF